jgi:hypothetical protein
MPPRLRPCRQWPIQRGLDDRTGIRLVTLWPLWVIDASQGITAANSCRLSHSQPCIGVFGPFRRLGRSQEARIPAGADHRSRHRERRRGPNPPRKPGANQTPAKANAAGQMTAQGPVAICQCVRNQTQQRDGRPLSSAARRVERASRAREQGTAMTVSRCGARSRIPRPPSGVRRQMGRDGMNVEVAHPNARRGVLHQDESAT